MSSSQRLDKIVIVDDDARIRDLLRRFLSQEGFDVLLAEDGRALDRILQRETIDMMVLDLMLPGEDGLSICKRLRASGVKTPVIMLTAKGEDVDRINGLEIGADDYLGKPFNPRELLARIHAVLATQTRQRTARLTLDRRRGHHLWPLQARLGRQIPEQKRRGHAPDHRRICHAQGLGQTPPAIAHP